LGPEGISGGPISRKQTLSIELDIPLDPVVEEVEDSKDDGIDESADNALQQTQATSERLSASAHNMQQTSLLELFYPIEQE
ncbi:uncharacterized protein M421DRAFT_67619, partial [Didymella exigua CBS 183.55]